MDIFTHTSGLSSDSRGPLGDGLEQDGDLSAHELSLNSSDPFGVRLLRTCAKDLGIEELLSRQAVGEGYSVGEHSIMALTQLVKYFPSGIPGLSLEASIAMIALHDAGKRVTVRTSEQHQHTLAIFDQAMPLLQINPEEARLVRGLIGTDKFGPLIRSLAIKSPCNTRKLFMAEKYSNGVLTEQDVNAFTMEWQFIDLPSALPKLERFKTILTELAEISGVDPRVFLPALVAYYQIDTTSYTIDSARDHNLFFPNSELAEPEIRIAIKDRNIAERYRHLERIRKPHRGYPSLEGLYQLRSDFSLNDDPTTNPAFLFDPELKRLKFAPSLEAILIHLFT